MTVTDHYFALLPCAGSGQRAATVQPKQYEPLAGVPLVVHTLRAWENVPALTRGVLVVAPDDTHMAPLLAQFPQPRFESVPVGGPPVLPACWQACSICSPMGPSPTIGCWCTMPPAA